MAEQGIEYKLFEPYMELTAMVSNSITWHIIGIVDDEIRVEHTAITPGIMPGYSCNHTAGVIGWMLFTQIIQTYMTSYVPDDIVWEGHMHPGICMN